jgi:geranylgeranyl diphosphate synthase, type II
MIDIDHYLSEKKELVNAALGKHLPKSGPPSVIEAMRYSLEAGGKRLRPILVIATAETLGKRDQTVLDLACAMECIHTYSLIHDDLPAMDDSDLRRGKPTCHKIYGEAVAILAGDGLLTMAFEIIARYGLRQKQAEKALKITLELAVSAGVTGMVGGQVLDLEAEGSELTLPEVDRIAGMKTGALLKASVKCGAIAAGAGAKEMEALSIYADCIGPAFQIIDDLLDYEGTSAELGKPAGADQKRSKATYPALIGAVDARKEAELLYTRAVDSLKALDRPAELLNELARIMVYRKS